MILHLEDKEDGKFALRIEKADDEKYTDEDIINRFISVIIGAYESKVDLINKDAPEDQRDDFIAQLHDEMSYLFTGAIERVFPGEDKFTFTDAAVFMAQDQLMDEALDTGVPIEKLIEKYNKKAESYVKEQKKKANTWN